MGTCPKKILENSFGDLRGKTKYPSKGQLQKVVDGWKDNIEKTLDKESILADLAIWPPAEVGVVAIREFSMKSSALWFITKPILTWILVCMQEWTILKTT